MPLAQDAKEIFKAGLDAVLPQNTLSKSLILINDALHVKDSIYKLAPNQRIFCFGSGKAAQTMTQSLHQILGSKIHDGLIVSSQGGESIGVIKHFKGSHPIPNKQSLDAGEALLKAMGELRDNDFYIYLLSGGSSALIESLHDDISLETLQATTNILLSHNLPITIINSVRKRLSKIKGGGLAAATKAKGIVLVISDVIGDDLQTIGSAPFVPTNKNIPSIPSEVLNLLPPCVQKRLSTTHAPANVSMPPHYLIATNHIALENAASKAKKLGYKTQIITDSLEGLASDVATQIHTQIKNAPKHSCFLYGGEPTVKITGNGIGGRNGHVVLNFLSHLNSDSNIALLSAGTDGIDGNSPAAGAYADKNTLLKSKELGLDIDEYIFTCNAYNFFAKTDDAIITGPSGTNVMDILIALKE